MNKHIILITGASRCGKSTFINLVRSKLITEMKIGGVICTQINNNLQERIGFQANYYASRNYYPLSCELAKINSCDKQKLESSEYIRFRKYLVNFHNIKNFIVPAIKNSILNEDIVIIDEIANMQLFCQDFKECIENELFNFRKLGIVTISEELYNSEEEFVKKLKTLSLGLFYLKSISSFDHHIDGICDLINIFMEKEAC